MTRLKLTLYRVSYAACALLLAAACGRDSTDAAVHDVRVEAGLQQVLDGAVARQDVLLPGAIGYWHGRDYAPWSGSAGVADLATGAAMRPDSRIRAGSVLKTFVATVTLQLVEEGILSLDQTLPELLPSAVTDRVANADRITLRMLLNHTSGIPEWDTPKFDEDLAAHPERVWTDDDLLGLAALQAPYFDPGTSWAYSNTDYTLVGMVLDRAGGASWRTQIRARLLVPLRLASTSLPEPGDRTVTAEYAHGYQDVGGTPVELSYVDPSMAGAAGGNAMVSTVRDLATFADALLAGRLFARPETLAEMTTMVEAPNGTDLPHWYGLGLEVYEIPGRPPIIGNSGGAAGYTVMMFQIPALDATLVTAVNEGSLSTNALDVFTPSVDVLAAPAPQAHAEAP